MSPILKIILSRLGMGILTLLIVSVLIFSAIELLPGDIATETLGQSATEETIAAFKERFNLNGPVHMRYLDWLANAVQGDFGPFERLNDVLANPYEDQPDAADLTRPPEPSEVVHQTFCGT